MSEVIGSGSRVTLHFAIKLNDGSLVDSNFDAEPASFSVGDQSLLPGFERCVLGLRSGDEHEFNISAEEGFGPRFDENIHRVPRGRFSQDMDLSPGAMVAFADANGQEVPGVVQSADDSEVVVDFNHPLAGRDLVFAVKIISVEAVQ